MDNRELMLGNEAIARGLMEGGCRVVTAYPGTPSTEILASVVNWERQESLGIHAQWAVNEKIAFEIAYTASMTGKRAAVAMKQVGLNVAADPLMSAAYLGTKGGFVVISADDPGPHSSQTEQDSRLMAMMAKIPVLDPDSPRQAKAFVKMALELSEAFAVPVMLRPTTRVCHARQDVEKGEIGFHDPAAEFEKNPARWAATPKFRLKLHGELEKKLADIASYAATAPRRMNPGATGSRAIVTAGVAAANTAELIKDLDLWQTLPLYQVVQPFPLHTDFISHLLDAYGEILVIEETAGVIEMQLADRRTVKGRLDHTIPRVGELLPQTIEQAICGFTGRPYSPISIPPTTSRRPTLCAGCPHRASFFAIKRALPKGIYTSDIGCYTLGLNLGAVDTVLCMGAAISQAAGFFHAFKGAEKIPDIVATIGDSTFFHSGIPALVDTVVQQIPYVLVVLDNSTTAMTGNQPTAATGFGADGKPLGRVDIGAVVRGCGVGYCQVADPYQLNAFIDAVKDAAAYARENGPAVLISKAPCILSLSPEQRNAFSARVEVTDDCDGCGYCIQHFECPVLILAEDESRVSIDQAACCGCGVCVNVCPKGAIKDTA